MVVESFVPFSSKVATSAFAPPRVLDLPPHVFLPANQKALLLK